MKTVEERNRTLRREIEWKERRLTTTTNAVKKWIEHSEA